MSENAKLTRGSIPGHLVTQTAPMIIGVAAIMSIGLVDTYFIGQLGAKQLAAMSFIFPISVALSSLGVGIMVGINSVVARALGAGDDDRAARRANFGMVFAVACGIVLGLALFLLMDPLFKLMNADEELLPFIRTYMRPFAISFPLLLAIMGINGVLRGQGEAKKTSIISITYAAANWVLDPILITGAFGIGGLRHRGRGLCDRYRLDVRHCRGLHPAAEDGAAIRPVAAQAVRHRRIGIGHSQGRGTCSLFQRDQSDRPVDPDRPDRNRGAGGRRGLWRSGPIAELRRRPAACAFGRDRRHRRPELGRGRI